MSDLEHAKSLLEMARGDLNSLRGMLASPSGENFFTVDLNPFAVQYRYESLDSDDDEIDRSTVLTEVQSVFNRVDDLIDRAERG